MWGLVNVGLHGRLVGAVLPDDLFHPDHVVPAAELVPAVVEGADQCEAQMLVEPGAVPGQVFVLRLRVADAGIQVQDAHGLQPVGQRLVQSTAHAVFPGVVVQVDGQLTGPVVSGPAHKGPRVGVALHPAVPLDDEVGVFLHGAAHAAFKFLQ